MRDKIAHAAWKHEATIGTPKSVADARTLAAFADSGDTVKNKWLATADAIIAALPGMIPDLVWEPWYFGVGFCETGFGIYNVDTDSWRPPRKRKMIPSDNPIAAANAHHRAAVMAAFGVTQ